MRHRSALFAFAGIILAGIAGFLAACGGGGGSDTISYTPVSRSNSYSGSGDEVYYVDTNGYVDLTYTLNGLNTKDVYFVLSNTNPYKTMGNPVLNSDFGPTKAVTAPSRSMKAAATAVPDVTITTPRHVQEFNAKPPLSARGATGRAMRSISAVPQPQRAIVSVGATWYDTFGTDCYNDNGAPISGPITARYANTIDGVRLTVWIPNALWGSGDLQISQNKLDAFVAKFLVSGQNNDIHDWVTNIFGPPWGTFPSQYNTVLILDTAASDINILLYDIDGDGFPSSSEGRTVGFFYARDNFSRSSGIQGTATSNQLLMFYIDAPVFSGNASDASWDISDKWPSNVISTLAHEFQHMINFYQKSVLLDANSETWVNEMTSMVTEDLVADKALVNGPRGVSYNNASAGNPGNTSGRLPLFNLYNDVAVTQWLNDAEALKSYSINYALGAYLARNFGGAQFFRNVVQCNKGDYTAIDYALSQTGSGLRFADILQRWGAAVLLSYNTVAPAGLQYNKGDWFTNTLSIEYNLGSINLYNYKYYYIFNGQNRIQAGPYLYSGTGPIGYYSGYLPASNLYYEAAIGAVGSRTWNIRMDSGVRLTVVVKQP